MSTRQGDRFLFYTELREKGVPYTRQHLNRMEQEGAFPRRVHLGPGRVGWSAAEIDDWIEARKAERQAVAA